VNENQTKESLSGSWLATFFVACWLNFFVFFLTSLLIGGSGSIGKIQDGKYYVGNHGKYTEVSQAMFEFSRIHGTFSIIILVTALLIVLLSRRKTSGSILRGHSLQQWSFAISLPLFWLIIFLLIRFTSP
jgi:hypothetical protein